MIQIKYQNIAIVLGSDDLPSRTHIGDAHEIAIRIIIGVEIGRLV